MGFGGNSLPSGKTILKIS